MDITAKKIIAFWYAPQVAKHWFASTPELDAEIRERFQALWEGAAVGELDHWQEDPEGCLALAIVLDQFPLNMFRDQPKRFSTETKAIQVARHAVDEGLDRRITAKRLAFLYMPFMHSEALADQELSVRLFSKTGLEQNRKFALHHKGIVERFGRFPHRNAILGRVSTEEEATWLASDHGFRG